MIFSFSDWINWPANVRERTSRLLLYSGNQKPSNWSELRAANGMYQKNLGGFVDFSPKFADVKIVPCFCVYMCVYPGAPPAHRGLNGRAW